MAPEFSPDQSGPVADVMRHGDALEPYARRRGLITTAASLAVGSGLQALAGYPLVTEKGIDTQQLLSTPSFTALAGSVFGAAYALSRYQRHRNVVERMNVQEQIRTEVGGLPVDLHRIVRSSGRRQKRHLQLRWYGADGTLAEPDTAKLSEEFFRVAEYAEKQGIEEVAVSAAWVRRVTGNMTVQSTPKPNDGTPSTTRLPDSEAPDISKFGRIGNNSTEASNKLVTDTSADPEVLILNSKAARELAETLGGNIQGRLAQIIGSGNRTSRVLELYQDYSKQQTPDSALKLLRQLRAEIATIFDEEPQTVPTQYGPNSPSRLRVNPYTIITDQYMLSMGTTSRQQLILRSGALIQQTGAPNLDDLIERALLPAGQKNQELNARVALYLSVLARQNQQSYTASRSQATTTGTDASPNTSLFQRMQTERMRTFPVLRRHGKTAKEAAPTIEYLHRHKRWKRFGAAILLATSAVTIGSNVGNYVSHSTDTLLTASRKQYETDHPASTRSFDHKNPEWVHAYHTNRGPVERTILDGKLKWLPIADKIHNDTDQGIYNAISFLNLPFNIDKPDSWNFQGNIKLEQRDIINAYMSGDNTISTGDVMLSPEERSLPLFKITKLGSANTSGYWVTDTAQSLQISDSFGAATPPLKNSSLQAKDLNAVEIDQSITLPLTPPANTRPLFMVETPYVIKGFFNWHGSAIRLPYKIGTDIIAAQLLETDPKSPLYDKPAISISMRHYSGEWQAREQAYGMKPFTGPANVIDTVNIPTVSDISAYSKPAYRYWLAPSALGVPKADKPMSTAHYNLDVAYTPIPIKATQATRAALGLKPNASGDEIKTAITQKAYSYTPYASSGIPKGTLESDNVTDQLAAVGETLARMPYGNCNTSASLFNLATGGTFKGKPTMQVAGYMNHDDDTLQLGESHTWVADSAGNTIDPTASSVGQDPNTVEERPNTQQLREKGAAMTGIGILGIVAYRRRRQLAHTAQLAMHARSLHTLSKNAQRDHDALSTLQHHLFAAPGDTFKRNAYAIQTSRPLADRIAALDMSLVRTTRRAIANDARFSRQQRRQMNRLFGRVRKLQAAQALRRAKN